MREFFREMLNDYFGILCLAAFIVFALIVVLPTNAQVVNVQTQSLIPCEVEQVEEVMHWVEISPGQFYYVRDSDTMVMADVTYESATKVWVASANQPLGYFMTVDGAKKFSEKSLQPASYRDIPYYALPDGTLKPQVPQNQF